ncbi:armadillo-type protein [Suillus paluster]|uniref:armadillo-type protein n=1 Tax=Suillus paluster TaxID=48578 RepID=UPI001B85F3F6|nr:armadillo-type protein [Suillus paluster]KAG1723112.1 armadillo-type protein [Suillus paluster]
MIEIISVLVDKFTMHRFDFISDLIIYWTNKSVREKGGWTLIQVSRLVYEKATGDGACSTMYARLCRKMIKQISPDTQHDGIRNSKGKLITGGRLFRRHLLHYCQEDFEQGLFAKEEVGSNECYAVPKAKRQGPGLIKFIGELFKLHMLRERIMHECVVKLLSNVEHPEEGVIESLCQLLETVGQLLDMPKAHARMNAYFLRMKDLGNSPDISSRIRSMLQNIIELRDRKWDNRNADAAPTIIAASHETVSCSDIAVQDILLTLRSGLFTGCQEERRFEGILHPTDKHVSRRFSMRR